MHDGQATLPGDFVAGLVEGEGCFAIKFRRDIKRNRPGAPVYFGWQALFAIVLRKDDALLLEKVMNTLGCGSISYSGTTARYHVQDTYMLVDKVMPFFKTYGLYGKKQEDFQLWCEAIELISRNKRKGINLTKGKRGFARVVWDEVDLQRLEEIRHAMIVFKSTRTSAFKW